MFRSLVSFYRGAACLGALGLFLACSSQLMAQDTNLATVKIHESFEKAHARFQTDSNNLEAAWQFARSCFDLAELATNNPERADYANQGIAAGRQAVALNTNSAAAHYYLGMNIGELAETKRNPSAFRMVKEMEREFLTADALDEHFDYGGPDRNLGLLYRDAPVIISIGSRTKSHQHLEEAADLAPGFPENHLNLIESYLKWGYRAEAVHELEVLEKLWPDALKNLTGDTWALSWVDWNKRLKDAQKKLEEGSKTAAPPHSNP
jgi:tetratricopeptide (TPR) repeat protein